MNLTQRHVALVYFVKTCFNCKRYLFVGTFSRCFQEPPEFAHFFFEMVSHSAGNSSENYHGNGKSPKFYSNRRYNFHGCFSSQSSQGSSGCKSRTPKIAGTTFSASEPVGEKIHGNGVVGRWRHQHLQNMLH